MPEQFDPYYEWLGIPPKDQPPNHYRLLGIELFEQNLNVIDRAADRQMGHVRSFQTGKHVKESQRLLNELSSAKVTLLSAAKRADYDRQLREQLAADSPGNFGLADDAPIPELPPGVPDDGSSATTPAANPVRKSIAPAGVPAPAIEIRPARREGSAATTSPEVPRTSRSKLGIIGIAVVLIVGSASAAFYIFFDRTSNDSVTTPNPTLVQEPKSDTGATNSPDATANDGTVVASPNENPSSDGSRAANVSRFAAIDESLSEITDPTSIANPPQVPATIRNTIMAAAGMYQDRFAFCQTLLWTRFDEMNQALRAQGFRLTRCRPYLAQGDWRVAAIWIRDGQPSRVVGLTDSETLLQADERLRQQGFMPVDVFGGADGPLELFVAVWTRPQSPVQTAMSLGIAADEYQASQDQMTQQGLRCAVHSAFHDSTGKKKFCDLWIKPAIEWSHGVWEGNSSVVEEQLSKASVYTDVCALALPTSNEVHFVGIQWFDKARQSENPRPGQGTPADPVKSFVGIHPEAVRDAVVEQVKAGYLPDTLSVASASDGNLICVTLWRPGDGVKSAVQLASLEPPSPTAASTPAAMPAETKVTASALQFAGKGSLELRDTVQLLDIHQDFTVEAWLRFDEQAFDVVNILCGTAAYRGLHPEVGTKMMKGWLAGIKPARAPAKSQFIVQWAEAGGATQNHTGEIPGFDNAWHHLALCNRGSSGKWEMVVYLDGQESLKASFADSKDAPSPVGFYFGRPQWVAASRRAMHGLLRGLKLSNGIRYSAAFQPEKDFQNDEQTLALLDFANRADNAIADLAGKRQPATLDNLVWTDWDGNAIPIATASTNSNAAELDAMERFKPPSDYGAELTKVREVFKSDIASAKDPQALAALAEKILQQVADERDSSLQYALLVEARRMAIEGLDWNVAVRCIDELAARFDVEVWEIRAEVFNGLAKKTKLASDRKLLADKALSQAESALAEGFVDVADSLLSSSSNLAPRGDRDLVRAINDARKRLTDERKIQQLVREAQTKLDDDPDDAAANESLGKYLCFTKDDWNAGIPHLAKGPDGKLKSVALLEASEPTEATGWVPLATSWHDLAKSSSDTWVKNGAMHRALHWYQLAQPDLSGVSKTQVDKSIEELSKSLATSSKGKIKFAWLDGAPGVVMELRGHTGEGTSLAVTRAGRFLVSGSLDDTVRVWDLSSGKPSGQIIPTTGDILSLLLSPDDRVAIPVSANGEYSIGILSLQNRQLAGTIKADGMARQLAGSQDWRRVVYAKNQGGQNNLLVYNLAALSPMAALSCPGTPVHIAVSRTGRFLAAGDDNNVVYVWDLQTGKMGSPLTGHNEAITGLAFSPNERQLVSSSYRSVIVWDLVKGVEEQRIAAPNNLVTALAFSPDGSRLIFSGYTTEISVHNAQTGLLIAQVRAPEGSEQSQMRAITCFADGRAAAGIGTDGLIRIWRLPD